MVVLDHCLPLKPPPGRDLEKKKNSVTLKNDGNPRSLQERAYVDLEGQICFWKDVPVP